jgi:hypothetical protein
MGWSLPLGMGLSILGLLLMGWGALNDTVMFVALLEGERQISVRNHEKYSLIDRMGLDTRIFYVLVSIINLLLMSFGSLLLPPSVALGFLVFFRYFFASCGCSAGLMEDMREIKLSFKDLMFKPCPSVWNQWEEARNNKKPFNIKPISESDETERITPETWSKIFLGLVILILGLAVGHTYCSDQYFSIDGDIDPLSVLKMRVGEEFNFDFFTFWGLIGFGTHVSLYIAACLLEYLREVNDDLSSFEDLNPVAPIPLDNKHNIEKVVRAIDKIVAGETKRNSMPQKEEIALGIGRKSMIPEDPMYYDPMLLLEYQQVDKELLHLMRRDKKLSTSEHHWKYTAFLIFGLYIILYRAVYGVLLSTWPIFVKLNSVQMNVTINDQVMLEDGFSLFISHYYLGPLSALTIITIVLFSLKVSADMYL